MLLLLQFVFGLVLLVGGAEAFVRGASRLAIAVRISPLVVGLTVVSFGTSAPELAVSMESALTGHADFAVGNVIGSNIANVLLILGIAAVMAPLVVAQKLIRLEVPLMIGASVAMLLVGLDGTIGLIEGVTLVLAAVGYTVFVVRQSRRETNSSVQSEYQSAFGEATSTRIPAVPAQVLLVLGGLGILLLGAHWLVDSATQIARSWGMSELTIAVTIVAIGTSLPEVATSVVASLRGETDIAVGNVLGSNLLNILLVLGLTSTVSPGGIAVAEEAIAIDIPVMIGVATLCLPVFLTGYTISRREGILFLILYVGYLALAAWRSGAF